MEFKTKKFADLSFGNYLSSDKNKKLKYSFNHIIDQRIQEINQYFKNENECKKYILSNELYIYTYDEEYYDKFIFLIKQIYGFYDINLNIVFKNSEEDLLNYLKDKINKNEMPKFDYIIQNPPYNGSMHLNFFDLGLKSLKKDGQMIIIEPSQWLINLRHTNKLAERIKERIKGHIKSIIIENLNREFNISNFTPLTISEIDFSKTFKEINFKCCGEEKIIYNLDDANLIGSYKVVKSILDKCTKLDIMKNHIYNKDKSIINDKTYFTKFAEIISVTGCIFSSGTNGANYNSDCNYKINGNKQYMSGFLSSCYHINFNKITNHVLKSIKLGSTIGTLSDKDAACLYGTKEELENWKYYVYNNKLPLFINICMTIDQHNNSINYVPWLVDKKYTDEEIYKKLNLNQEEINLIDKTIKKFERYSPWFKRYSNGLSDDVNDQVIKEFIKKIS